MMRFLAGLLAAAALLAACSEPLASNTLIVGLEPAYPPFESATAEGTLEGLDIDLVRALGEHLGRPVEFREMAFDALIPELEVGRIDLVCSGVSWTAERALVIDFSKPYVSVPMGVLLSAAKAPSITDVEALDRAGVVIAVQRGTSGDVKARERFPRAEVRPYDNEVAAANEVVAGRAHALVYDMVSVVKHHELHRDETRVLDQDLGVEQYCMALRKGSPLLADVDAFLGAATGEGGALEGIMARWLPQPERFRVRRE